MKSPIPLQIPGKKETQAKIPVFETPAPNPGSVSIPGFSGMCFPRAEPGKDCQSWGFISLRSHNRLESRENPMEMAQKAGMDGIGAPGMGLKLCQLRF